MKLLVQGDDFGFTKAVTYGIVDAIDNGVLRNTGLFANMPDAPLAVSFMKDRPHVCFGIDFNIVSGPSCADPNEIPDLVDEEGNFIRSTIRVTDPRFQTEEGRREMFPYEQVYREVRAQYDRFVEMAGKKPGYLHGHSLMHENYMEAIHQLSEETGVPFSSDIKEKYDFHSKFRMNKNGIGTLNKKEKNLLGQLEKTPLKDIMDNEAYFLEAEYSEIGGHPGFVDQELLDLTTLSLERVKDHAMMTSQELKEWIEKNKVELITYYDLY